MNRSKSLAAASSPLRNACIINDNATLQLQFDRAKKTLEKNLSSEMRQSTATLTLLTRGDSNAGGAAANFGMSEIREIWPDQHSVRVIGGGGISRGGGGSSMENTTMIAPINDAEAAALARTDVGPLMPILANLPRPTLKISQQQYQPHSQQQKSRGGGPSFSRKSSALNTDSSLMSQQRHAGDISIGGAMPSQRENIKLRKQLTILGRIEGLSKNYIDKEMKQLSKKFIESQMEIFTSARQQASLHHFNRTAAHKLGMRDIIPLQSEDIRTGKRYLTDKEYDKAKEAISQLINQKIRERSRIAVRKKLLNNQSEPVETDAGIENQYITHTNNSNIPNGTVELSSQSFPNWFPSNLAKDTGHAKRTSIGGSAELRPKTAVQLISPTLELSSAATNADRPDPNLLYLKNRSQTYPEMKRSKPNTLHETETHLKMTKKSYFAGSNMNFSLNPGFKTTLRDISKLQLINDQNDRNNEIQTGALSDLRYQNLMMSLCPTYSQRRALHRRHFNAHYQHSNTILLHHQSRSRANSSTSFAENSIELSIKMPFSAATSTLKARSSARRDFTVTKKDLLQSSLLN